jgi:hypothetical protein
MMSLKAQDRGYAYAEWLACEGRNRLAHSFPRLLRRVLSLSAIHEMVGAMALT